MLSIRLGSNDYLKLCYKEVKLEVAIKCYLILACPVFLDIHDASLITVLGISALSTLAA